MPTGTLIRLVGGDVEVVLDARGGAPAVLHWGAPLGPIDDACLLRAVDRPARPGSLDVEGPTALVPEEGSGFAGRPGLLGRRPDGSGFAPRFALVEAVADASRARLRCVDAVAGLQLELDVAVDGAGVLALAATLENTGASPYELDALTLTLPVPSTAVEAMTLHGRWCGEFRPRRSALDVGATVTAESRAGRTSHEHVPFIAAGTAGFREESGEVRALHVAWSGNHVVLAERLADGRGYLQGGELLLPGEVVLEPGERYEAPRAVAAWSDAGLNGMSRRLHRHLRARPAHPGSPRPVILNTWEAVYYEHDTPTLMRLAERAAEIGVERFVLDDGWFGGRRSDAAGLGDWWVSPDVYPDGLGPLIDHVRGLGMEFGLWVEPEMANPDSDILRAHPDWVLADPGYPPVTGRGQLVLDLANPAAFAEILGRLDALLRDHAISYLKWDMNRDHVQAAHGGRAGTHAQTLAAYRLLDALRARHPGVEIESCASGGARADYGILERTCRIWTSDSNDAVDRQAIQRGCSYLFPPELMGAHVGPPRSHTTGRVLDLPLRAATAIMGHMGVEWDLLRADADERAALAEAIAVHRRLRPLLHSGDVIRIDHPDPAATVHAVVAADRAHAVVSYAVVGTPAGSMPPRVRMPGLDRERRYRVELIALPGQQGPLHAARRAPAWMDDGVVLTGAAIDALGLQLPGLGPGAAALLELRAEP